MQKIRKIRAPAIAVIFITIVACAMGFASGHVRAHEWVAALLIVVIPTFLLLLFLYLAANAKHTWVGVISFLAASLFALIWLFIVASLITGESLH